MLGAMEQNPRRSSCYFLENIVLRIEENKDAEDDRARFLLSLRPECTNLQSKSTLIDDHVIDD